MFPSLGVTCLIWQEERKQEPRVVSYPSFSLPNTPSRCQRALVLLLGCCKSTQHAAWHSLELKKIDFYFQGCCWTRKLLQVKSHDVISASPVRALHQTFSPLAVLKKFVLKIGYCVPLCLGVETISTLPQPTQSKPDQWEPAEPWVNCCRGCLPNSCTAPPIQSSFVTHSPSIHATCNSASRVQRNVLQKENQPWSFPSPSYHFKV